MTKGEIEIKAQEMALLFFAALPEEEKRRRLGIGKDDVEYLHEMDDIAELMRSVITRWLKQK